MGIGLSFSISAGFEVEVATLISRGRGGRAALGRDGAANRRLHP